MRKLASFAAPCSGAILLAVLLLPERWLLPLGIGCLCLGLGLLLREGKGRMLLVRLSCFGLAAGFLWTALYQGRTLAPARQMSGSAHTFTAVVTDWPAATRYGASVEIALPTENGTVLWAVLYGDESLLTLRPGDTVRGSAALELAHTVGGEESDTFYARGIFLTGSLRGALEVDSPERVPFRYWPAFWARHLKEQIARSFPADVAGLVSGLVTGDKSGLDDATYTAFQRTGTAHVVAVSGLHVSFLAGVALRLLGRGRRRTAVLTILLMAVFAGIAGYTPSVLRAAFLQTMLLIAPLVEREGDGPTSLSLALLLLLLQNPYAGAGIGLQLSFASVAGIQLCAQRLYECWTWWLPRRVRGLRRWGKQVFRVLAASLATTLGALLFTTPLLVIYFGELSLVAPLANLMGLGAVAVCFAGGLGVAVLGTFAPALAGFLGEVFALPGRYVLWVVRGMSRFPLAAVPLDSVYLRGWLILLYTMLILWAILRRGPGRSIRPVIPLCTGVLSLCAALMCGAAELRLAGLTLSVLDVGQGQSVALFSQGRAALVDCGGSGWDNSGDVAADYFQSRGVTRLDALILTHFHADHTNGVEQLLERMEVELLIAPDVEEESPERQALLSEAEAHGTQVLLLDENAQLTLGQADIQIYRPMGDGGGNEEGLSLLASTDTFDALLTGDMNTVLEERLVKYGALPDVDVLIAGHHGSKYASSERLLEAVRPEYAVLSVGYNSYGHPAPETLARLEAAGCAIYRTDWMGTITFRARE